MPEQNKKIFFSAFLLIAAAELLSFLGYFYAAVNFTVFFIICAAAIALSWRRLEYGLYIILTELFVGSFGYLFYFASSGHKISLRMALWLIIMSVWAIKTLINRIKTGRLELDFFRSRYRFYFSALFIFIVLGLINGFSRGNSLSDIFFDFNSWLYFLLIFPIFSVFSESSFFKTLKQIFLASITWLSVKTLLLAYFFSHNFNGFAVNLYHWLRTSETAEITSVTAGFSRVFMQSQIFILIGFFILLFYLLNLIIEEKTDNKKLLIFNFPLLALFLSAIIMSFSRSFWLGLAAGGLFVLAAAIFKLKINLKKFIIFDLAAALIIILSFVFCLLIIKFPFPAPYGGFNAADLFGRRATGITGEAGASSRWQLLPPLREKISAAPVFGLGFGATVTYKSSDPRVLENNPTGEYTTYAFEWGWLDLWLKLGLFGLLAYLALFIKIIHDGLKINSEFSLALVSGLIVLMAVNIFSPYVNHPLGIGYLIIAAAMMELLKNEASAASALR